MLITQVLKTDILLIVSWIIGARRDNSALATCTADMNTTKTCLLESKQQLLPYMNHHRFSEIFLCSKIALFVLVYPVKSSDRL